MKAGQLRKGVIRWVGLSFLFVFVSCTSVYYVEVQIPEPAVDELPDDIQSVLIVNRAVDGRFDNINKDSIQRRFYEARFDMDTMLYDTLSADTAIQALGELLFESGRYDIVIPENRFLPHKQTSFFSDEMLWPEVKELCNTFNTDVVLSLDHFKSMVSTKYSSETIYDEYDGQYHKAYYAAIAIQYEALFRVYDPVRERVIKRSFLRDTLFWDNIALTSRQLFSKLTPVKTALTETGIAIALEYAELLAPQWIDQQRNYYYKGSSELEKAHVFVLNDQWVEAMGIWQDLALSGKSKGLRSKAEYNLAVAYELDGDIESAIKWGIKSYKSKYNILTYSYLELLEKRRNELNKTKKNN